MNYNLFLRTVVLSSNSNYLFDIISRSIKVGKEPIGEVYKSIRKELATNGRNRSLNESWDVRGYANVFTSSEVLRITRILTADGTVLGNQFQSIIRPFTANSCKILYTLCVDKEHLEYFIQCLFLDKEVDNRIFTLVVDGEFDTKNSYATRVRPSFRKYVKRYYEGQNIKVQYETDIFNKFYKPFEFTSDTIPGLKLEKQNLIKELLTLNKEDKI